MFYFSKWVSLELHRITKWTDEMGKGGKPLSWSRGRAARIFGRRSGGRDRGGDVCDVWHYVAVGQVAAVGAVPAHTVICGRIISVYACHVSRGYTRGKIIWIVVVSSNARAVRILSTAAYSTTLAARQRSTVGRKKTASRPREKRSANVIVPSCERALWIYT